VFAEGSENSEHTAQRQFTSQAAERLAKDEPLPQVSRFPRGAEIAAVHSRSVHLEKMACPAMGVGHAMAADRRGVGAQVAVEFFHRVGLLREEDAVQGGCEPTPGDRAEPPFGDCGGQLGNGGIEIGRDGQPDEPREHLMVARRLPGRGRRSARQARTAPPVAGFGEWLAVQRRRVSAKSRLGETLAYIHNHWVGLQTFLTDDRV